MEKFVIVHDVAKFSSINRTIRVRYDVYDEIMRLGDSYHLSFNKIVNQCLEFALKHLDESYKTQETMPPSTQKK